MLPDIADHCVTIRYIISMAVADWSGQAWLNGFNEVGQMIFDMSADALMAKKVSVLIWGLPCPY